MGVPAPIQPSASVQQLVVMFCRRWLAVPRWISTSSRGSWMDVIARVPKMMYGSYAEDGVT